MVLLKHKESERVIHCIAVTALIAATAYCFYRSLWFPPLLK